MSEPSNPPNPVQPGPDDHDSKPAVTEAADDRPPQTTTDISPTAPENSPPVKPPKTEASGADEEEPVEPEEKELGGRMTFLEHLDELRRRILYSLVAIIVAFGLAWTFHEEIYAFLAMPISDVVPKLVVITPTEPFTIYLKVAFTAAIFLSSPWILGQVWMFIAPGLYRREKRFALPFLLGSTVLFLLGGSFAYYIVLPPALKFLLLDFGKNFQPMITAMEFFDFALMIIIGMGAVFQLPIVVAFLSIFGLVTPRFLWKNFRYAFLIITIIAALVSPTTDPFNLFLWTGPMVVLYTISIGVSWIFKRRREQTGRE